MPVRLETLTCYIVVILTNCLHLFVYFVVIEMQEAKFFYSTLVLYVVGDQGQAPAPLLSGNRTGTHCTVGWAPGRSVQVPKSLPLLGMDPRTVHPVASRMLK
jgi:hypothetical protein